MQELKKEKQKLIQLGPDALAKIVLGPRRKNKVAYKKPPRISKRSKSVKWFQKRLDEIKSSEEYWSWDGAYSCAEELSDLIQDIKKGISNPEEGISLVSDFFESDEFIFERVDDSSGSVGDIYTTDAFDLFAAFARKCKNKQIVIEVVAKLAMSDNYGVRDCLIDEAHKFLSTKKLRELFDFISTKYNKNKFNRNLRLRSLARKMKDAPLFEKLVHESFNRKVSSSFLVEIAEVYFESGDFQKAQSLIDQISNSEENTFVLDKKIQLQKKLLKATRNKARLEKLLMSEFKKDYSESSLKELLKVVGKNKKQALCTKASTDILKNKDWDSSLALFLMDCCKSFDDAEKYILKHIGSLDGEYYFHLLPIAEKMESKKKYLVASLIYRALLDSILDRGKSKYYYHGIKYLKKLDHLGKSVKNWAHFPSHLQYSSGIKMRHERKKAFWSKYR